MAFTQGNIVSWADIVSLFSSLNTARQKFGYSSVTPADAGFAQGAKTTSTQVSKLKTYIEQVSGHSSVGSTASTGVTVPAVGSLLKFDIFNKFKTTITNISNTCLHDSFDSSFDRGFNGGFNSSFNGFDTWDSTVDRTVDSGFDRGFNGSVNTSFDRSFDGSVYSTFNRSFDSSFHGSFNRNFNSGYFTFNNSVNSSECAFNTSVGVPEH